MTSRVESVGRDESSKGTLSMLEFCDLKLVLAGNANRC